MPPEITIGFEIRTLNNLIKRDVESSKAFELGRATGLHGWAIGYFYNNRDRDVFQRDFEAQFSIRRSTASKILGCMEKNGLIERHSVENDARLKKIVLTPRATELHELMLSDIRERERRLSRGIAPERLDCFFEVIQQIKENLEVQDD